MQVLEKTLPGLDRMRTAKLIAFFSDITCGENCWNAKEEVCRCECGGKNHGIHLRGENAVRACRIDGRRYELVEVGFRPDLLKRTEQLIRDAEVASGKLQLRDGEYYDQGYDGNWFKSSYIHPSKYQGHGSQYVLKYASQSQCLKWNELAYFECADEQDRYHKQPAILWKRADLA